MPDEQGTSIAATHGILAACSYPALRTLILDIPSMTLEHFVQILRGAAQVRELGVSNAHAASLPSVPPPLLSSLTSLNAVSGGMSTLTRETRLLLASLPKFRTLFVEYHPQRRPSLGTLDPQLLLRASTVRLHLSVPIASALPLLPCLEHLTVGLRDYETSCTQLVPTLRHALPLPRLRSIDINL